MRKKTEGKGFWGGVVITVLTAGLMFLLTGALLTELGAGCPGAFAAGIVLFCAVFYMAIAAGVITALYQRWHEIQGGEEDEAKKY